MQSFSVTIATLLFSTAVVQAAPSEDINNIEVFIPSNEALTDEEYPVQVSISLKDSSDSISESNEESNELADDR